MSTTARRQWTGLAGWLGVTLLVAVLGGLAGPGEWYAALEKPAWTPPDAVFAPVWTVLYLAMAVAAWLVWKESSFRGARDALVLYLVQLALNGVWPWIFFGAHRLGLSMLVLVALWLLVAATLGLFWRERRAAGLLLVPYLLWVGYAGALNLALLRLNG